MARSSSAWARAIQSAECIGANYRSAVRRVNGHKQKSCAQTLRNSLQIDVKRGGSARYGRAPFPAQPCGLRRPPSSSHDSLAMQKVEGSSPFIRFRKAALRRGCCCLRFRSV